LRQENNFPTSYNLRGVGRLHPALPRVHDATDDNYFTCNSSLCTFNWNKTVQN